MSGEVNGSEGQDTIDILAPIPIPSRCCDSELPTPSRGATDCTPIGGQVRFYKKAAKASTLEVQIGSRERKWRLRMSDQRQPIRHRTVSGMSPRSALPVKLQGRLRDKTTTAPVATSAARHAIDRQAREGESRGERETHAERDRLTPRECLWAAVLDRGRLHTGEMGGASRRRRFQRNLPLIRESVSADQRLTTQRNE